MSLPIEEDAGDDEHCRHRQHVCECLRGSPLGGFLHAGFLPKPGRDSSWRENAQRRPEFLLGTPLDEHSPDESPLGEVDCVRVEQYCGGNLTRACRGTETVWAKSS